MTAAAATEREVVGRSEGLICIMLGSKREKSRNRIKVQCGLRIVCKEHTDIPGSGLYRWRGRGRVILEPIPVALGAYRIPKLQ